MTRSLLTCGAVLLGALTAACGSTVQVQDRHLLGTADPGQAVGAPTPASTTVAGVAAQQVGRVPRPGTTTAAVGTPALTTGQPGGVPATGAVRSGPGVTPTSITIGIYTANGYDKYASAAGVKGISTGDQTAEAMVVVNYINRHGGVLGRQLKPVFHDYDIALAESNPASESQAACSAWTDDSHVLAVVAPSSTSDMDNLTHCLSQRGAFTISELALVDGRFMSRYGKYFYAASGVNETRALRRNVEALYGRGFFPPGHPVGVVRYNTSSDIAAVDDGLVPALRAHGLKADVVDVDIHGTGGEYPNIVLRFKSEGVQSVLFTWTSVLLFSEAAQTQAYQPRMGISTLSLPQFLQQNVPPSQLKGALGISWNPSGDTDAQHDPGVLSPRQKLCLQLGTQAGQDMKNRSVAGIMLGYCDALFFLADGLTRAGTPNVDAFQGAVRGLGSGFSSALTFRTLFGPTTSNDGAAGYRMLGFGEACGCFSYVSPVEALRQ